MPGWTGTALGASPRTRKTAPVCQAMINEGFSMTAQQDRQADIKRGRVLAHLAMLLFAALIAGSFSFGGIAAHAMDTGVLTFLRYLLTTLVMGILAYGVFRQRFAWPVQPWRFLILG